MKAERKIRNCAHNPNGRAFFPSCKPSQEKKKRKEKLDPFPTFLYLQMIYNFFSWGKGAGTKQNKTKQNKTQTKQNLGKIIIGTPCGSGVLLVQYTDK